MPQRRNGYNCPEDDGRKKERKKIKHLNRIIQNMGKKKVQFKPNLLKRELGLRGANICLF